MARVAASGRNGGEAWLEAALQVGKTTDGAQSIQRAFRVLRLLATSRETGFGLTEIARATALTRPTVHRLLTALIAEGVVEQRPRTRRYVVGGQIQLSALARPVNSPLLSAAVAHLNDAVSELGDTLFLTLRADRETICVARRLGSYPIQVLSLDVGDRRPLGVSSAGIAMLATLRMDTARGIVMGNKRHLPAYGMTVEDALAAIARARAAGYALRERGLVPGTRAVSVTLVDSEAPAALTIAAITRRMQLSRTLAIVDRLRTYAARIEASLQSTGSRLSGSLRQG